MNIVEQLNGAADKVRHNVHTYRRSAAERARKRVSQAAKAMAAARTPVDTLAGAAQRLNDLTHDAVAKLVRQNAGSIEDLITGSAARSQSSWCCAVATSWKSTLAMTSFAECWPPSRAFTARLISR